jgi:hypothetical protein
LLNYTNYMEKNGDKYQNKLKQDQINNAWTTIEKIININSRK